MYQAMITGNPYVSTGYEAYRPQQNAYGTQTGTDQKMPQTVQTDSGRQNPQKIHTGTEQPERPERIIKKECQTCKRRKYRDGSNEGNVSFKSAAHISPESAPARVRAHENEHVANAYHKAGMADGKVIQATVSIHTAICPECGRVYVSGGTTTTRIAYPANPQASSGNTQSLKKGAVPGTYIDYSV